MEVFDQFMELIQTNVVYAPYLIFGLLLLAGLNLPVSEDAMLFISAILAAKNPDMLPQLFLGVFLGAYFSDLICYSLGRFLGPKLWKIKWFAKMIKPEQIDKLNNFYAKYGVFTLIFGRFIPFGIRNGLFLTAGLSKMNFKKFAFSDFIAASISCTSFFALYYKFGESVVSFVKKFNLIVFGIAIVIVIVLFINKKRKKLSNSVQ